MVADRTERLQDGFEIGEAAVDSICYDGRRKRVRHVQKLSLRDCRRAESTMRLGQRFVSYSDGCNPQKAQTGTQATDTFKNTLHRARRKTHKGKRANAQTKGKNRNA